MNIEMARSLLGSLKNRGLSNTLSYTFGRFHAVRRAYGLGAGLLQRPFGASRPAADAASLFSPIDVRSAVRQLETTALFQGLTLPAAIVDELVAFAKKAPLRPPTKQYEFRYDEVQGGRAPNGDPAILAVVTGAEHHPLVRRITDDPQVREVVRDYLGYDPPQLDVRVMWSFVTDCPPAVRTAASQTIDYHFDVQHYSFMYVNYYLTDTDARSGAHAMVLGSHRDKPLRWLLGSARQSDDAVTRNYGAASELVIEGPRGTGFIQDASCYHKALAPIARDRLMLHVRYF